MKTLATQFESFHGTAAVLAAGAPATTFLNGKAWHQGPSTLLGYSVAMIDNNACKVMPHVGIVPCHG